MDTQQVKFCETTQEKYDALTKDAGTLYFTSDTKRLYKGSELYSSALTPVYGAGSKLLGYALVGQIDKPLVTFALLPTPSDASPLGAGTSDPGASEDFSRADHVHPAETHLEQAVATPYNLSSDLLPITVKYGGNPMTFTTVASIDEYEEDKLALTPSGFPPIAIFDRQTGVFLETTDQALTEMAFAGTPAEGGVWPKLDVVTTSIQVRGEPVQMPLSSTQLANIEAVSSKASKPSSPTNGDIATLDANGDLVDSGLNAAKVDERISTMRQACEVLWWDDPSKYNNRAGGAGRIWFRPREVGMWDGGCITVINFHTASTTAINANIYLKLVSSDQQTVYATSDTQSINGTNIWVPFTFTTYAPLEKDTQYVLQFIDASTGSVQGTTRPTLQPWTNSPDLYFIDNTNRPHITVRWLMDLTNVKEKLEDHESRIAALESSLSDLETALQQINNGGQS